MWDCCPTDFDNEVYGDNGFFSFRETHSVSGTDSELSEDDEKSFSSSSKNDSDEDE